MIRHWQLKALAAVGAIALFFFGLDSAQSDPTLREMQSVTIAELEGGKTIRADQYLAVTDAYVMPFAMVKTSKGRKSGEHAHVFAALGSQALQEKAFASQSVTPVLWVRLPTDYGTMAAAKQAMDADALYEKPLAVSGVVESLASGVQEEMSKNPNVKFNAPLFFEDGSSPMSLGNGVAFAVAGGLILLVLVLWTLADLQAAKWLETLRRPDAQVYLGKNMVLLGAVVGAPLFVAAGSHAIGGFVESRTLHAAEAVAALAGLALMLWGFWRSRAAAVLSNDTLELVGTSSRNAVALAQVTGVLADERKVKGMLVGTYTLQGAGKPFKVGSSWMKGGIDQLTAFGIALREVVARRVGPKATEALQRGESVSFGPLGVTPLGLSKGGSDVVPWDEIASAELKNGKLKVKQKGKMFGWGSFSASKIVNIDVLMYLLASRGL